jgi:hypothetical protein
MFETTGPQDFRVEANKIGVVHYSGRANVKRAESVVFRVPQENIQQLAKELEKSGVFDASPQIAFLSEGGAWRLTTTIALYKDGRTRSLVYQALANPALHATIYTLLERYIPTESLRCPHLLPASPAFATGGDICTGHPRAASTQK